MDSGRVSTRYAKAIYEFAEARKDGEAVYSEMKCLVKSFFAFPDLMNAMQNPTISAVDKEKVLITSAGISVSDTFVQILKLIRTNHRESNVLKIALMYQDYYRKKKDIIVGKLVTAEPISSEIKDKLKALVVADSKKEVDFDVESNPSLIGGFVIEIDSNLLDASIKSQLNKMKYQLVEKNKKLLN